MPWIYRSRRANRPERFDRTLIVAAAVPIVFALGVLAIVYFKTAT